MSRLIIAPALAVWAGSSLLLGELRWFRRPRLVARLRPYAAAADPVGDRSRGALASVQEVLAPLAGEVGARVSRAFGVTEELSVRLERIHADTTVTAFRLRQLGWAVAAFTVGGIVVVVAAPPPAIGLLMLLGGPLLAFLVLEQHLAEASARHQRRLRLELPVVSEQLGMLLSAGHSLGGALDRLARRGHGACATDLARVCGRIRQGLADIEALREWAAVADVEALTRLVAVLSLNREATDLGRLISDESRTLRRDVQRELLEAIERRGQQVWIPVTVATLVPGVLFLAVPFIEAMRLFSSG